VSHKNDNAVSWRNPHCTIFCIAASS